MTILIKRIFILLLSIYTSAYTAETSPLWQQDVALEKKINDAIPNKKGDLSITDIHAYQNELDVVGTVMASTGLIPGIPGLTDSLIQQGAETKIALVTYNPQQQTAKSIQPCKKPDGTINQTVTIVAGELVIVTQNAAGTRFTYIPHEHTWRPWLNTELQEKQYTTLTLFNSVVGSSCNEYFACNQQGCLLQKSKDETLAFYAFSLVSATPTPKPSQDDPDFWALDNLQKLSTIVAHHSNLNGHVQSSLYTPQLDTPIAYTITDLAIYDNKHACALGSLTSKDDQIPIPALLSLELDEARLKYTIKRLPHPQFDILRIALCTENNDLVVYALTTSPNLANALYKASLKKLLEQAQELTPPAAPVQKPPTQPDTNQATQGNTPAIVPVPQIPTQTVLPTTEESRNTITSVPVKQSHSPLLIPSANNQPIRQLAIVSNEGNKQQKIIVNLDEKQWASASSDTEDIINELDNTRSLTLPFTFSFDPLDKKYDLKALYQDGNTIILAIKYGNRIDIYSRPLFFEPEDYELVETPWLLQGDIAISTADTPVTVTVTKDTQKKYVITAQESNNNPVERILSLHYPYPPRRQGLITPVPIEPPVSLWSYIKKYTNTYAINPLLRLQSWASHLPARLYVALRGLWPRR